MSLLTVERPTIDSDGSEFVAVVPLASCDTCQKQVPLVNGSTLPAGWPTLHVPDGAEGGATLHFDTWGCLITWLDEHHGVPDAEVDAAIAATQARVAPANPETIEEEAARHAAEADEPDAVAVVMPTTAEEATDGHD